MSRKRRSLISSAPRSSAGGTKDPARSGETPSAAAEVAAPDPTGEAPPAPSAPAPAPEPSTAAHPAPAAALPDSFATPASGTGDSFATPLGAPGWFQATNNPAPDRSVEDVSEPARAPARTSWLPVAGLGAGVGALLLAGGLVALILLCGLLYALAA